MNNDTLSEIADLADAAGDLLDEVDAAIGYGDLRTARARCAVLRALDNAVGTHLGALPVCESDRPHVDRIRVAYAIAARRIRVADDIRGA